MHAQLWVMVGAALKPFGPYQFEEAEFTRLKDDYLAYVNDSGPSRQPGGAYKYNENGHARQLVVNFALVALIE